MRIWEFWIILGVEEENRHNKIQQIRKDIKSREGYLEFGKILGVVDDHKSMEGYLKFKKI